MAIGIALGGPLGLALGDTTLMAAGIAIGCGTGWGIGRELRVAYDPERPVKTISWPAVVAGAGAVLGGLLDGPVLILLGIALGAGFGAMAGRRYGPAAQRR